MNGESQELLEVKNLQTCYFTSRGAVKAVDNISFTIRKGETLGLVGESGCGKSTVALAIMRLVPVPGRIIGGQVLFKGRDLLLLTELEMRKMRGGEIAMSFQDPMTFFNPVMRIGDQIVEGIVRHQRMNRNEALERAVEMLSITGVPSPRDAARSYPHQLSGGMRQRSMMAMALACNPSLLIADEPTTALDVIIQAQLLELMKDLRKKLNTSYLIISHDLGVVADLCDNIAIMYSGQIVEYSDVRTILKDQSHPYTFGLLSSIPRVRKKKEVLSGIEGSVPDLVELPPGCRFSPRCPYAKECGTQAPERVELRKGHYVLCNNPLKG